MKKKRTTAGSLEFFLEKKAIGGDSKLNVRHKKVMGRLFLINS